MTTRKRDVPSRQLANTVRDLTHQDARRHRAGFRLLIHGTGLIGLSNAGKELDAWTTTQIEDFRTECLTFLRSLVETADKAGHASVGLSLHGPMTFRAMASSGKAHALAWGGARDVLILQLLSLIQLAGVETLRVCAAHGCDRLFVRVNKRECCSETCTNRKTQKAKRDRDKAARIAWEAEQKRSLRKGRR